MGKKGQVRCVNTLLLRWAAVNTWFLMCLFLPWPSCKSLAAREQAEPLRMACTHTRAHTRAHTHTHTYTRTHTHIHKHIHTHTHTHTHTQIQTQTQTQTRTNKQEVKKVKVSRRLSNSHSFDHKLLQSNSRILWYPNFQRKKIQPKCEKSTWFWYNFPLFSFYWCWTLYLLGNWTAMLEAFLNAIHVLFMWSQKLRVEKYNAITL